MNHYLVCVENMPKLEKTLKTIANKCAKFGCEFSYVDFGPVFKEKVIDGVKYTIKYEDIGAEGTALVNGFRFVGTIEHTGRGNVIKQYDNSVEVPKKYYTSEPVCEHCNSKRVRKETYLVYNEDNKEFKQVGKTCLKVYTGGLDAEQAVKFLSYFDKLEEAYEVPISEFGHVDAYFDSKMMLTIGHQLVTKYGYKKREVEVMGGVPTADLTRAIYLLKNNPSYGEYLDPKTLDMYEEIDFDSEVSKQFVDDALTWLENKEEDSQYIHSLKVVCLDPFGYTNSKDIGILVSLVPTYLREVEYNKKKAVEKKQATQSSYQGEVGNKITFQTSNIKVLSYNDDIYGSHFFYQLTDKNNNVYVWSTGKDLDLEKNYLVTGVVKDHKEFRGTKQTVVTRCKVQFA